MVRAKFRNPSTRETGIITCEETAFWYKEVIACGVEKVDGVVDIIDIQHSSTGVCFHINIADLYWIKSA